MLEDVRPIAVDRLDAAAAPAIDHRAPSGRGAGDGRRLAHVEDVFAARASPA